MRYELGLFQDVERIIRIEVFSGQDGSWREIPPSECKVQLSGSLDTTGDAIRLVQPEGMTFVLAGTPFLAEVGARGDVRVECFDEGGTSSNWKWIMLSKP